MDAHPPFSWREQLYGPILGVAIGLGVGFLLSLGHRPGERWISIVYGLLVGLGISSSARLLEALLHTRLEPLTGASRLLAYMALFFASGAVAWILRPSS